MSVREQQVQNQIIAVYGNVRGVRIWRQNTGVGYFGKRKVTFGVPGQADISGLLADGTRLEIEVKSATGTQSGEQKAFQRMIEKHNGVYILARSVEDVYDRLRKCPNFNESWLEVCTSKGEKAAEA